MQMKNRIFIFLAFIIVGALTLGCMESDNGGTDVQQAKPCTFALINQTDQPLYIQDNNGIILPSPGFDFEREVNGAFESIEFGMPDCVVSCEDYESGDVGLCINCDALEPTVRKIEPGERFEFQWEGMIFSREQPVPGDCPCYREQVAPLGTYRVSVCTGTSFTCEYESCEEVTDNRYWGQPENISCVEKEFNIPLDSDEIVLNITNE